ncbi:hypothetical protein DY000_02003764 [Brassica cretica]|uniref:1,3-beta-glucan synthase n=1 Tax=Brassica cretica TaxID=69181 RepID=A0ABQ7CC80_BRACR|nr:hypothetical protein DY000_02003764 [Brassica cretica]
MEPKLDDAAVHKVFLKSLDNYIKWCDYLGIKPAWSNLERISGEKKLLFLSLYFLIWGEAANIRFLPECLCYIFHQMVVEMNEILRQQVARPAASCMPVDSHGPHGFDDCVSFLDNVIAPLYEVVSAEALHNENGRAPHSEWRNYDDFNEYFWSLRSFELGWPWRTSSSFFQKPIRRRKKDSVSNQREHIVLLLANEQSRLNIPEEMEPKLDDGAVHKVFLKSLDSYIKWCDYLCIKPAWSNLERISGEKKLLVLSLYFLIWGEAANIRFLPECLCYIFHHMVVEMNEILRQQVSRPAVSCMPVDSHGGSDVGVSFLDHVIAPLYEVVSAEAFHNENGRAPHSEWRNYDDFNEYFWSLRSFELSWPWRTSSSFFQKPIRRRKYEFEAGRDKHRGKTSFVEHRTFLRLYHSFHRLWIFLAIMFQIAPLVGPTRMIMKQDNIQYSWHEFVSIKNYNALTVASLWAPVVAIYLLDIHIFYTIASAFFGFLLGARDRLGEIRSLEAIHKQFEEFPGAFMKALHVPVTNRTFDASHQKAVDKNIVDAAHFAPFWNQIIKCLREEDYITDLEMELLLMPKNSGRLQLVQWPLFLLSSKILLAKEIAAESNSQEEIVERIGKIDYMKYAVEEVYHTLKLVLAETLEAEGRMWVERIYEDIGTSIKNRKIHNDFQLNKLSLVITRVTALLGILKENETPEHAKGAIKALQDLYDAIVSFTTMQFQLCTVFFTFSLGTRTHYFGRTILHGGARYQATGRGFVVKHITFSENYRLYSRSHFVKGLEVILLLVVYLAYGNDKAGAVSYILLTVSSWFLAGSWLFAPFLFNPAGFEWQKVVVDFTEWTNWLFYRGGIGVKGSESWEAWWEEELSHIRTLSGRIMETILSLRFFVFQYGIVYKLKLQGSDTSFSIYGWSWAALAIIIFLFKVFTFSRKISVNFQLVLRLAQGIAFLVALAVVTVGVVLTDLSVTDIFASVLALIPTGWGILSIACAWKPIIKRIGMWKSIRSLARLYDAGMGMLIFLPVAFCSWFPFLSTFQTRMMFNQGFSRGLEISLILAGNHPNSDL